jgi:hypothetical protein
MFQVEDWFGCRWMDRSGVLKDKKSEARDRKSETAEGRKLETAEGIERGNSE